MCATIKFFKFCLALREHTASISPSLPPSRRDTIYKVRCDAFHCGASCLKRGTTKGKCDLCHFLLGETRDESLRHILLDCPFSRPITTHVHLELLKASQPNLHGWAATLAAPDFLKALERRIIFGTAACDPLTPTREKLTPAPVLLATAAATLQCLLQRRNHNAFAIDCPLQYKFEPLIKSIRHEIACAAAHHRTIATREENMIYTHYEGWLPEKTPTDVWKDAWLGNPTTSPWVGARRHTLPDHPTDRPPAKRS